MDVDESLFRKIVIRINDVNVKIVVLCCVLMLNSCLLNRAESRKVRCGKDIGCSAEGKKLECCEDVYILRRGC